MLIKCGQIVDNFFPRAWRGRRRLHLQNAIFPAIFNKISNREVVIKMLEFISLELLREKKAGKCECGGNMNAQGAYVVCGRCSNYEVAIQR